MPDIRVKPARAGMRMRHIPSGIELPDEGGSWPADSFTFRRITDGDLVEVAEEPADAAAPEAAELPTSADEAVDETSTALEEPGAPAAADEPAADHVPTPPK